ncbi:MAG: DOMON-like domain-containing protein [Desulfobulbaceae bacterium]|nr:MAG: DOMON-like domain-containing protein [Desulfobulbaceae bacterium]
MAEQFKSEDLVRSARHIFLLQRFRQEQDEDAPCLAITGSVRRQGDILFLQYRVSGDIGELVFSPPEGPGHRRHGLWQRSCFEAFLGVSGAGRYWEFNLAPCGDWNVYAFSGYREGMVEETAIGSLPTAFHVGDDEIWLDLQLDLRPLFRRGQVIEAGISAVMEHRDGGRSLWALSHQGPVADFHHRSGFQLAL